MCGIAGVVSADPALRARIGAMTDAIAHRGPDDAGIEQYAGAVFGHRRLSIIDLEGGHQPLSNAANDLHIVFNGEIYNFQELRAELLARGSTFRTRTDTEVILALYERDGLEGLRRLRGMFAFGVWDDRRQRLVLVRDRMGQKPMFYRRLPDGGIAFASEVKGLLAGRFAPPTLDVQALYHYVSLRYIPDDRTLFGEITKLPAATWLVLENGSERLERYWEVSYLDKLPNDERAIGEELDTRLREAVRLHAISDVPVGTFLSGGIDSSLVTAMLSDQAAAPISTFSIGVREQDYNELPYARAVADQWHTQHHEETASADLVRLLPTMIWHMDELADPFGVGVFLVSRLAARHVKVVLTGDGGDELFAGYDRFAGNALVDLYALVPAPLRRTLVRRVADRLPDSFGYKSLAQKVRWVNEMSLVQGGERYALSMSFLRFTDEAKASLFTASARAGLSEPRSAAKILEHYEASSVEDAVDRMLHTDCMTRLPDHLLLLVDRMAMAHGVEARPPLIDHEIVEFAARIPANLKLNGRKLKYILRQVSRGYLDASIVDRKKQGFGFPIARWMRTTLAPLLRAAVAESRLADTGIFERAYMERILEEHLSGKSDHNFRLWILLNLELWHRMYIEGASIEDVGEWIDSRLNGSQSSRVRETVPAGGVALSGFGSGMPSGPRPPRVAVE